MSTTTIRVDTATHASLVKLASTLECTLIETVAAAAEALRRRQFADEVRGEFETLRADESAWSDYLAEIESSHVNDGIA